MSLCTYVCVLRHWKLLNHLNIICSPGWLVLNSQWSAWLSLQSAVIKCVCLHDLPYVFFLFLIYSVVLRIRPRVYRMLGKRSIIDHSQNRWSDFETFPLKIKRINFVPNIYVCVDIYVLSEHMYVYCVCAYRSQEWSNPLKLDVMDDCELSFFKSNKCS